MHSFFTYSGRDNIILLQKKIQEYEGLGTIEKKGSLKGKLVGKL